MFVVLLSYTCDISKVEQHLAAHVAYLEQQYAAGVFLASGRKVPRTGGVILAQADSRDQLLQILAQDPFQQQQLADYEVIEFIPSKTAAALAFLQQ